MRRLVVTTKRDYLEIARQDLLGILYGHRGTHPNVWTLSPFEFVQWFEVVVATHPTSLRNNDDRLHHCLLTDAGKQKLRGNSKEELIRGADYEIAIGRDEGHTVNGYWVALSFASSFRNEFVFRKREKMCVPKMEAYSIKRGNIGDDHIQVMRVMFGPWVSLESDASAEDVPDLVPHKSMLKRSDETWLASWLRYVDKGVANRHLHGTFKISNPCIASVTVQS